MADLLVSNAAESCHIYSSSYFDLAFAPICELSPALNVSIQRDNVSNGVGIPPKVSFQCLMTKGFNINIAISLHLYRSDFKV